MRRKLPWFPSSTFLKGTVHKQWTPEANISWPDHLGTIFIISRCLKNLRTYRMFLRIIIIIITIKHQVVRGRKTNINSFFGPGRSFQNWTVIWHDGKESQNSNNSDFSSLGSSKSTNSKSNPQSSQSVKTPINRLIRNPVVVSSFFPAESIWSAFMQETNPNWV